LHFSWGAKIERYRHMTDKEKLRAYNLRGKGISYEAISAMLSQEAEDGRKFDRATIYRVRRSMPRSPADEPFQWHRLEEYGLPWEASSYLLELLVTLNESPESPFLTDLFPREGVPTVRTARWVWRTHLAVPDQDVLNVWLLAQRFAQRELFHEVLGVPFYVADLEAQLAYRPWEGWPEDLSMYNRYLAAVQEGRIPPLEDQIKWIDQVLDRWKQIPRQFKNIPHIGGRPMTGAELAPLLPVHAELMQVAFAGPLIRPNPQAQEALE
jgi:hypothetical protein